MKPAGYLSRRIRTPLNQSSHTPPSLVFKYGDLNGDNIVNTLDAAVLVSNWNKPHSVFDVDGNGIVNVLDIARLIVNWSSVGE